MKPFSSFNSTLVNLLMKKTNFFDDMSPGMMPFNSPAGTMPFNSPICSFPTNFINKSGFQFSNLASLAQNSYLEKLNFNSHNDEP